MAQVVTDDAPQPAPPHGRRWVTRSRRLDVALFLLILLLMLALCPRLRVYYRVTVVEVEVERVLPDGRREALATPRDFAQVGNGYWPGDAIAERLSPRIDQYMKSSTWASEAPAGTRFEWTIRWAENSTRLDQVDRVVWEVAR